ncbi:MAG: UDP-N-acetylmuramoyl-L-alanyl-D-glutamate--2,6-diaminopimelate ligase [Muribaculaceae bacterium]|nr:UDP-N-acetylmuramoyl-L-alanyl-D-glutamate--2,6-diaminopimelate ligase [Muribaculaceae bacterium]MCI6494761.1 UDP-N-acetylmuramoyl-L-alanyl-D-glutamate--2,6-diaminopimelate ligase [Bacteroidales bacterium]MDD6702208.1 UDP-N-acetylmuramoyl-L-alanyl-D-glutamate--2,6-diaminopimelate ligase [Bacteroidales bacterium]MDD6943614.1 UDP-N-acetylmuramoyl-L-alanyl-D-glutamate--2,6-diaminopimelate ligase [Bacteroidales bacterium]MDY2734257.1 UDP-N-acetylmuramoyl-L-alanyl-D-glutamate--2,6-diaminopimelate 
MKLSKLLEEIKPLEVIGETDKNIIGVHSDSRKVEKDSLFVAVRGVTTDGHKYIPVVASTHVGAIVCEDLPSTLEKGITYVRVANSAEALGMLASAWYGHPSSKLKLVGVTGTNGKTTTATLLYEMAKLEGYKAGLLSTVCNYIQDRAIPTTHTTPDPLTLNELLAEMVEAGCDYAFMEVSSHAAQQHRIAGLKFKGGIFSNLTRDHLDYHGTVENYINAKKMFFDILPEDAFALVNIDDKVGMYMTQNTRAKVYTYSLRAEADFRCKILETRLDGTLLDLDNNEIEVGFTGRFNAYNLTAVYGAAILTGFPREEVAVNMSRLVPVAGRFQTFRSADGVTAIVDYAHTPDALVNVLDTIREVVGAEGKITTVVGAGGNRDHGKRPMMAREAACRSDLLLLTSDNPRDENPDDIIADMRAGLTEDELRRTICITDRREAIKTAVRMAAPGTVILIAGKGHEPYQEVKGVRHHFDDREEVERELAARS